jgi:hypothetical protein
MLKNIMTKMSTKSLTRAAKPLKGYDKVAIGLAGIFIFGGSLLSYQIFEMDRRVDKIYKDEFGKNPSMREKMPMISHRIKTE